jgi:ABC-type lipoprotein release transport system permease subunit
MKFLILISFRNLLRQKRRNLLLGAAIAIGMAMLAIANSFSHGISDVMFNRILTYVTGHVSVAFSVKGNYNSQIFRDGDRMLAIVREAVPQAIRVEEAVGIFTRVVGNGVSDNVILIGMDMKTESTEAEKAEMKADFPMLEGSFEDISRLDVENPVLLAAEKAAFLKVGRGDVLRARFLDVYGRNQAVRLTVSGVFKPANIFMTAPVFMDVHRLKTLAGYGPNDISGLHVTLPDPKMEAIPGADSIHAALHPALAAVHGRVSKGDRGATATVLGFQVDTLSLKGLADALGMADPDAKSVLMGASLADSLGLRPGDACTLSYAARRGTEPASAVFKVTDVIPRSPDVPGNAVLVNDRDFYAFYYGAWPRAPRPEDKAFLPDSTHRLHPFLNREWVLMPRTKTTEAMQKKYREATRLKTRATQVDVQTMYESASMIIKLEYALNLITLAAVLILFFIIQVGVVNTLRMTILERTREIGTMRAIGMQRGDVRTQFLLETFFLSAAACIAGLVLAFIGMALLRQIHFVVEANPLGMLLVNGRLHFKPTVSGMAAYVMLILLIAAGTAWFPARRAANLSPADALRHFG